MHIAIIPARKGSEGFKFKNRKFFDYTAKFLHTIKWFEKIIVSTDDPVIKEYAQRESFSVHDRPDHLAGPAVSIQDVFKNIVEDMNLSSDNMLWLFYLPILYRNKTDFEAAKPIIEDVSCFSTCSFIPAKVHPYNCWKYDTQNKKLTQYIKNDVFRRQDLPAAWMLYHYICCVKVKAISNLNSELVNSDTHPIFLDEATRDKLIEIDTPDDYEKWKLFNKLKEREHFEQ